MLIRQKWDLTRLIVEGQFILSHLHSVTKAPAEDLLNTQSPGFIVLNDIFTNFYGPEFVVSCFQADY